MIFLPIFKSKPEALKGNAFLQDSTYFSSWQLLYEFFYLFSCSKEVAMAYSHSVWQSVYKKRKDKKALQPREERFFRRDLFSLAIELLEKEDLSAHFKPSSPFFSKLSPFEFTLLLLRDRFLLEKEEIEVILNCTPGSLSMELMGAREKFSSFLFPKETQSFPLLERVQCNQVLDDSTSSTSSSSSSSLSKKEASSGKLLSSPYYISLEKVRSHCQWLTVPPLKKKEIQELFLKSSQEESLEFQKKASRKLSLWQNKLSLQALGLGALGSLLIVFLSFDLQGGIKRTELEPASFSIGELEKGLDEGVESSFLEEKKEDTLPEKFPLGPSYKKGAAHKAPSLQRKAIYRLIVQSENPKEVVPHIRNIFQETKVQETSRSGNTMPGGIYFDGITLAKNYPKIHKALSRIAPTNAYLNTRKKKVQDKENARVIIWVQQI